MTDFLPRRFIALRPTPPRNESRRTAAQRNAIDRLVSEVT